MNINGDTTVPKSLVWLVIGVNSHTFEGNEKYFHSSTASGNPEYVFLSVQITLCCYENGSKRELSSKVGYNESQVWQGKWKVVEDNEILGKERTWQLRVKWIGCKQKLSKIHKWYDREELSSYLILESIATFSSSQTCFIKSLWHSVFNVHT